MSAKEEKLSQGSVGSRVEGFMEVCASLMGPFLAGSSQSRALPKLVPGTSCLVGETRESELCSSTFVLLRSEVNGMIRI